MAHRLAVLILPRHFCALIGEDQPLYFDNVCDFVVKLVLYVLFARVFVLPFGLRLNLQRGVLD